MDFFWTGTNHRKGLPLIKWEIVQRPNSMGGLGVEELVIKNVALLIKGHCFQFTN